MNPAPPRPPPVDPAQLCPVCGARLVRIRCKSICQSPTCIHRVVLTCCDGM